MGEGRAMMEYRETAGKITISCQGDGVRIEVYDDASKGNVCAVEIEVAEFTAALGGLARQPCTIGFNKKRISNIGKIRYTKKLSFEVPCPYISLEAKEYAQHFAQKFADDGWVASTYFNSQDSFFRSHDGKIYAKTTQMKWVEDDKDDKDDKGDKDGKGDE